MAPTESGTVGPHADGPRIRPRLVDVLRQRGLRACAAAALREFGLRADRVMDAWFDPTRGTDTSGHVESADLTVVGPHRDRGVRYQPADARALRRVLEAHRIPRTQTFLDLGCGKGRALLVARDYGFRRIVGIDYASSLCEIARRNVANDRRHRRSSTPVSIECRDAAEYPFCADETVIFLFNPFDAFVMERVIANLGASMHAHPRRTWLIYLFPRWHAVIEGSGLFELAGAHVHGESEFTVYLHDPGPATRP